MSQGAGDKDDEQNNEARDSDSPAARGDSKSWTERARSRPGPDSPLYVPPPPKWAARYALVMLYVLYVGVPILCAAMTVWLALRQRWLGAGVLLLVTAWWGYRGWNGLHGRTPYGPGNLPALKERLKDQRQESGSD
jgi:hypothetical protein